MAELYVVSNLHAASEVTGFTLFLVCSNPLSVIGICYPGISMAKKASVLPVAW